ncbi:hypothetical protein ACFE04_020775 [Oxalis oulophora]
MTYNGLESVINNQSYEAESGTSNGCSSDSFDDGSSCSSSKDVSGSFSSKWLPIKKNEDEWEHTKSPKCFYVKEKSSYSINMSDVETMKENFAKLLLGEDITGGRKALSTALALSNAITSLAVSVFGELWKLEPLPREKKNKWRREMDWMLSPTNHMVELVPAKQYGANGRTVDIMTLKARADIHVNLPALQKLDSMLMESLDSTVSSEFWYAEVGNRAEGRTKSTKQSKRWWLPLPQVPKCGLSETERKKLTDQAKVVNQVFKAAKSISENVLLEMPVPTIIEEALPKSGKESLNEQLSIVLSYESISAEEMLNFLCLKSEHDALAAMNRLEAAMFAWNARITKQNSGKSPARTSWSPFTKDLLSEMDKIEIKLDRAKALRQRIKMRYPNLPQTFLDATKIQYGKDVGHAILEAYSRALGNLAFSIQSRIGEILQEDALSNPNSPVAVTTRCIPEILHRPLISLRVRHSLIDQMNNADGKFLKPDASSISDIDNSFYVDRKSSTINATPSRIWCIGREACVSP